LGLLQGWQEATSFEQIWDRGKLIILSWWWINKAIIIELNLWRYHSYLFMYTFWTNQVAHALANIMFQRNLAFLIECYGNAPEPLRLCSTQLAPSKSEEYPFPTKAV
jgi:hypothetical protein